MKAALAGAVGVVGIGIIVAFAGVSGVRAVHEPGPDAAGLDRGQMAVPDGSVGRGQGLCLRGFRLRHAHQPHRPAEDRLLQLRHRRRR